MLVCLKSDQVQFLKVRPTHLDNAVGSQFIPARKRLNQSLTGLNILHLINSHRGVFNLELKLHKFVEESREESKSTISTMGSVHPVCTTSEAFQKMSGMCNAVFCENRLDKIGIGKSIVQKPVWKSSCRYRYQIFLNNTHPRRTFCPWTDSPSVLVHWDKDSSSIEWPNRALTEAWLSCTCKCTDCVRMKRSN